MLRYLAAPVLFLSLALAPAQAQEVTPAAVSKVLRMTEMMDIMQAEGLAYGEQLQEELFPDAGSARWQDMVALIYDAPTMQREFEAVFEAELAAQPEATGLILDFFGSERGQRIVTLEIEARRALLDEAVEEAAQVAVQEMMEANDPRFDLLLEFAEINQLVEENVAGAMNSNLAFYRGMAEGGAFDGAEMTEQEILSDVWTQEPQIRADTEQWLYPFLSLAYQPLSDEDMQAYIAFSETPASGVLNRALFAAFDDVFSRISHDLGRAAAGMLAGQDI